MPELPFLQVLAENLDAQVRGRTITAAELHSPSLLRTVDPPLEVLAARRIDGVRRIAKLIVIELSGELAVVLHLMRDGRVQLRPPRARPGKALAHRHGGEPCPRCGTRIAEVAYAERSTYYCPSCQTGGRVYADRRLSRLLK